MTITDGDLQIKINNISFSNTFLINSNINYSLQEEKLSFIPVTMRNDKIPTKLLEEVRLDFAVVPEDKKSCKENFINIINLIDSFKPEYSTLNAQYLPDKKNFTGLVKVQFKGLQRSEALSVHLNQFSYKVDKDMGFIKCLLDRGQKQIQKMVPISFIISLSGVIILPIQQVTTALIE